MYMLGSDAPIAFDPASIKEPCSERPGILADISSAYDSPKHTIAGWTSRIVARPGCRARP